MFMQKKNHREVGEIPLAPIIDMLVCVIFFLILSTSFEEYNKVTLPPSSTTTYKGPSIDNPKPPVSPKLYITEENQRFSFSLKWHGDMPDQIMVKNLDNDSLENELNQSILKFKNKFPQENSIQLYLSMNIKYQKLISIMDIVTPQIQDVVFGKYSDVVQAGF